MIDIAIEQRDEAIAEALVSGRSVRVVRKEFGLTVSELDAALERLWPVDNQARLRMIRGDVGKLDRLTEGVLHEAFYRPRSHRRCWTAGADVGERWPSRLVATAAFN
jgi:hypothetical protein